MFVGTERISFSWSSVLLLSRTMSNPFMLSETAKAAQVDRPFERYVDLNDEDKDDSARAGGSARAEISASKMDSPEPAASKCKEKPDNGTAWFVYRGVPSNNDNTIWRWPLLEGLKAYFAKWEGSHARADAVPTVETVLLGTLGAFLVTSFPLRKPENIFALFVLLCSPPILRACPFQAYWIGTPDIIGCCTRRVFLQSRL